jgi:uncharacterized protein (DUF697 family)
MSISATGLPANYSFSVTTEIVFKVISGSALTSSDKHTQRLSFTVGSSSASSAETIQIYTTMIGGNVPAPLNNTDYWSVVEVTCKYVTYNASNLLLSSNPTNSSIIFSNVSLTKMENFR